jgi:hypothetical protein
MTSAQPGPMTSQNRSVLPALDLEVAELTTGILPSETTAPEGAPRRIAAMAWIQEVLAAD